MKMCCFNYVDTLKYKEFVMKKLDSINMIYYS